MARLPADAGAFLAVGGRDSAWRRGPTSRVAHRCFEHAGQGSGSHRAPGQPDPTPQRTAGGRLVAQDGDTTEVEEPEELVARVAAVDVAKASGMACTRVPHPAKPGRRATTVWQVPATTNATVELAEQLACQGVQRVVAWVHLRLLAGLVVPAGSPRPGGVLAGARDARAPAGPSQDRQAGRGVAGQAERAGHAAAVVRAPGPGPPVAGRHPAACRPDRRAHPAGAAAGAGCSRDALVKPSTVATDVVGVSGRAMLPGAGRRAARPQGAPPSWPGADARQAWRPGAGADRPLRRPPRRAGQDAAGPLRRPDRPDRPPHRPDRGAGRRHPAAQAPGTGPGPPAGAVVAPAASARTSRRPSPAGGAGPPGRGPEHRRQGRPGHHRRARAGRGPVPHPWAPGAVGQAVATDRPVRRQAPRRRHRQGQPLPHGRARRGRRRGRQGRHLPRAALPPPGAAHRQAQGPGRGRPLGPGGRLAPAGRPTARFCDLGAGFYAGRTDTDRKTRSHVRQLQALGYGVT
jgi:hypothetical protein